MEGKTKTLVAVGQNTKQNELFIDASTLFHSQCDFFFFFWFCFSPALLQEEATRLPGIPSGFTSNIFSFRFLHFFIQLLQRVSCRFLQMFLIIFSMPLPLQIRCLRYSKKFMGFSRYFSFHFHWCRWLDCFSVLFLLGQGFHS